MLSVKKILNGEIAIYIFLGMFPESFLRSADQRVKTTNHQFWEDHTKPNFRLQLVLLQKSPKKMSKVFLVRC